MNPRGKEDLAAIRVTVPEGGNPNVIGSPVTALEEGGGLLEGGLVLLGRFAREVDDPKLQYRLNLTVAASGGRLVVEQAVISRKPGGPPVDAVGLHRAAIEVYLQRILQQLRPTEGFPVIAKVREETESSTIRATVWSFPSKDEWQQTENALRRRQSPAAVLPLVAQYYREALADPDPLVRRRPSQEVARRLGCSRTHAARLVAMARKANPPLLGKATPGRAGEDIRKATTKR